MTTKKAIISLTFISFVLTSCTTYSIQTESLVGQVKQNQKILFNVFFPRYSRFNHPSNHIDSIKCLDKKGNLVWLYPTDNTELIFIKKPTGKKVRADFDTVIFQNDSLFSRRSPLFGKLRKIPVNDIDKIIIRVEKARIEPVTN